MQLSDPTIRLELIGEELRRLREAAGLKIADAAQRLGVSYPTISRMENGRRPQRCEDVAALLAVYGVTGQERKEMLQLTRESNQPGLWHRNCSHLARVATLKVLEERATKLINFEYAVVPGLLQTVPYAKALMSRTSVPLNEDAIGERVAARIHRQAVLRKSRPPNFLAVIAESALHNIVGDRSVMRGQLMYLAEAAQRRNIQLRVIPTLVNDNPGLDGPFMRLQFADRRGVIVLENRTSNLFLEDDEDLMTYNHVLVELLSVALSEEESVALVHDLGTRLAEEQPQ